MTMPSGRKRTAGKQSSELKRERMELRVAASAKQLIGQAMAVSGLTAGDFAHEGARRVLDDHQRRVLAGRDRFLFSMRLLIRRRGLRSS